MSKAIEHFKEQLISIRLGIPTASLIDTIKVDYHGQLTPIKYLAQTQPETGRIKIEPYDKTILGIIDKTLKASGFNSCIFSKTAVVISLPKIANAAEKEKVINQVRKLEEEAKVVVRNIRKKFRQNLNLPEEDQRKEEKLLQELTDKNISMITSLSDKKVKDLS